MINYNNMYNLSLKQAKLNTEWFLACLGCDYNQEENKYFKMAKNELVDELDKYSPSIIPTDNLIKEK